MGGIPRKVAGLAVGALVAGAGIAATSSGPWSADAAEAAACADHTLFVAGSAPAPAGDASLLSVLENRQPGLGCVTTVDDDALTVDEAETADLVVVSSSVHPASIGDLLRDAAVPVLVAEPFLFDDMSMVHQGAGRELSGRDGVTITDPTHPLAAGLSGRVVVFEAPTGLNYGTLDSGAILDHQVANTGGTSRRSTIFAYATGEQLVDGAGPARAGRVGLFPSFGAQLTTDGQTLVGAAVDWLLDRPAETPACGAVVTTDVVLTEDLVGCPGHGLIVGADGITIDLGGHELGAAPGSTSYGIDQRGHHGVTIRNGHISDFHYSVSLVSSHDNLVEGITTSRTERLVELAWSSRNTLRDLWANDPVSVGVRITGGSENSVDDVTAFATLWGLIIHDSHDNTVTSSRFDAGSPGYWHGVTVSGGSTGNTIRNVEASGFSNHGFLVTDTAAETTLDGNTSRDNGIDGIRIEGDATGTLLSGNTATANGELGIRALVRVTDGGGNTATGNGLGTCEGIVCLDDPTPRGLLVAGNANPPRGDRVIASIIEAGGVLLDIVDDDTALDEIDLSVYDVVFISTSVVPDKVGTAFRDAPLPVVTWEGALFDDMAMGDAGGATTPTTNLVIADGVHPLAADLGAGSRRVYMAAYSLAYATPSDDAEVVAHAPGRPNRAVLFAYDPGDMRADGTASPALRVGLFPSYDGAADLTAMGRQLVEATVSWVTAGGPPPNDDFADRFPAAVGATTGDNVGATLEQGEPQYYIGLFTVTTGSVWWEWTAPFTGSVRVDTVGSTFDTHLAVYRGDSVDALELIGRNDDAIGLASLVGLDVTTGERYQIAVTSLAEIDTTGGRRGDVVLNITETVAPANDDFDDAFEFIGNEATGSNVAATLEPGEPTPSDLGGAGHARSVWWTWTADADERVHLETAGSSFDTVLAVYVGDAVDALTEIASNDDCCYSPSSNDYTSALSFDAVDETTYHFAVSGYRGSGAGEAGEIVLARSN